VFRAVPAWRDLRSNAQSTAVETIARAEELETVLATFAGAMDTLEARIAQVSAIRPEVVAAETPAGASANAEALLAELARESLVRLDGVKIQVDTALSKQLPLLVIELRATADITGLSAFLQALERGPTVLAVRRLSVQSKGVEVVPAQAETLAVHLTIEGLGLIRTTGDAP
jgi:hypothetical protein